MEAIRRVLSYSPVFLVSVAGIFVGHWLSLRAELVPSVSASSGTVRAKQVELVDPQGRRRALIGTSGEGSPAIWFFDQNGKSRLNLGVYADGNPMIVLNDANEQAVQIFRTVGGGEPVLVMKAGGRDRIILGLNGEKNPYFEYYDAQGGRHEVF